MRLGLLKLAFVGVAFLMCWIYRKHTSALITAVLISLVLLLIINVFHDTLLKRIRAARCCSEVYRKGLMRLENRWVGTGDKGEQFYDPRHLYARDLDILGRGSLYELLCTCRTRMGKTCLAEWLLAPATLSTIEERQTAIRELREKVEFREELGPKEVQAKLSPIRFCLFDGQSKT
jgi:hypothetical protein